MAVVENLPEFIEPMLLTSTQEVPASPRWALEVKWDGMRAQVRFDGRRVTVRSRPGATRGDAYSKRRALLDDLALNRMAWRTPRAFSVEEDLATVTRDRHLEGVVAKPLDASYQPGRRGDSCSSTSTATASASRSPDGARAPARA
jgi:ATP-dependent DNA ligase